MWAPDVIGEATPSAHGRVAIPGHGGDTDPAPEPGRLPRGSPPTHRPPIRGMSREKPPGPPAATCCHRGSCPAVVTTPRPGGAGDRPGAQGTGRVSSHSPTLCGCSHKWEETPLGLGFSLQQ